MNLSSRYSVRLGWISKSFLSNLWKGVGSDMLLYICTEKVTASFGTLSDVSGHLVNVYICGLILSKKESAGYISEGDRCIRKPSPQGPPK